jgi:threonine/homoserine/homoserine lactone efflux protein
MSRRPNVAMTLRNSLVRTRGVRVNLAVSLTLGDAIHVAYCPMRIAVVISQSILLANILKWTGAAYLSFIGTKASLRQEAHLGRDRRCIENYRAHGHARGGSLGLSDEPPRSQNDAPALTNALYPD